MKLSRQSIIGFIIGAILSVGLYLLLFKPKAEGILYKSYRVDGEKLKRIYNGDFSRMGFYFTIGTSGSQTEIMLSPEVFKENGEPSEDVPVDFMTELERGVELEGERELPSTSYYFEHERVNRLIQLKTLVSLIDRNPGGYFEIHAADYPADHHHFQYNIEGFKSDGDKMDVTGINARALSLNPCPPAKPY